MRIINEPASCSIPGLSRRTTLPLDSRTAAWLMMVSVLCWTVLVFGESSLATAQERLTGHVPECPVQQATRFDWVFTMANQSLVEPPAEWLVDYRSEDQTYELYVPETLKRGRSAGLILFISPGERGTGFAQWKAVCDRTGMIFVSPHQAGNQTPTPRRVRIVLDALDDVGRRFPVDVDRTCIGGFSGGGRIAIAIATALPEQFAAVIPVCAGGELRDESALRQRVIDRLSMALITGETDFNRGEVERLTQTSLTDVGVRCRTWVVPRLGHGIPDGSVFAEVVRWIDDGQKARKKLADSWPASRLQTPPTREEWASQLLAEARLRVAKKPTLYSGLMQLKAVQTRWPDLPQSRQALQLLEQYESREDRPWEADDIAEQRRFLVARARGIDAYASGPLPKQYENQHQSMLKAAINLWTIVLQDGQDETAAQEARTRIPALQAMLEDE